MVVIYISIDYTVNASKAKKKKSNRASNKRRQESRIKKKLSQREFPILEMISKENSSSGENRSENLNSSVSTRFSNFWDGHIYNIIILISCNLLAAPILLYPQHNSILHQEYWYEAIFMRSASYWFTMSLDTLIGIKYYFKDDSMVSFIVFIQLYVPTISAFSLTCSLVHLVWTVGLGYNHPMPYTLLTTTLSYAVQYISLTILFYRKASLTENTKKRIRAYNMLRVWMVCIAFQYKGLDILFSSNFFSPNSNYQWILGFVMPLMREFNFRILYKILVEYPNAEDGQKIVITGINAFNSLYVAIKLGQTATTLTSVIILSIDFLLNIQSCFTIINLHRSTATLDVPNMNRRLKDRDYLLMKLILIELLEVLVPVSYVTTVLLAYFGPNAEILGNIGNDYWQYKSIHDIWKLVQVVLVMFLIDSCSALISGCMLWKVCSIHFWRETCELIRNSWPIIAVGIAHYLNYVGSNRFETNFNMHLD